MENSIFATIRKEQQDFLEGYISPVPGWNFNQYDTIKRIHLYLNSKYEDGTQYMGRDKLFFNVIIPPCEVAMRMLNVDTKQIRLWPLNPKSQFSTFLLEKELKLWLKKSKLGKVLNQIAEEAPRYGTVVLEKTPDGAKVVDLRHLILDPSVESIQKSRFVTTIHYMTASELRETGWENVDVAIERFGDINAQQPYEDRDGNLNQMSSTPYIKVHKRYGEVEAWKVDKTLRPGTKAGDKMVKALFIVAGADILFKNAEGKEVGDAGVVLFSSRWRKEWPFKDFHYIKTKGRFLGVGIPEMLFDVQVRINELKNQKRVSMELSSLHLFQTKDKQIVRNALTDLQNGDVLLTQNGIDPIENAERNLPAFENEEASYLSQTDRISFAYEAIRGDQDNQSTLGQTQIAVAQGTSVYAFKKENLSLFLQDFFNDLVMPQLMKDLTGEHIMRFVGTTQEIQKLDEAAAEVYANDVIKERLLNGDSIRPEEQELIKQQAIKEYQSLGESRFLKIKDSFYDDAEFEFDFLITPEQEDPSAIAQNLREFMAPLIQQYGLEDPRVKLLYDQFAQRLGVSSAAIELAHQDAQKMPMKQMMMPQMQPMKPEVTA
jgi:hypothetical protein